MINVIIPTYNEANNIKPFLRMLSSILKKIKIEYLIVVVDDNSPDGTYKIVKKLNLKDTVLVRRKAKAGLASAYEAGLKYIKPANFEITNDFFDDTCIDFGFNGDVKLLEKANALVEDGCPICEDRKKDPNRYDIFSKFSILNQGDERILPIKRCQRRIKGIPPACRHRTSSYIDNTFADKKHQRDQKYELLLQNINESYTVILDSDLQHDPYSIIEMFRVAVESNADIVSGTRYRNGRVSGWPFSRKLTSSIANNLARYTLGLKTSDLTGSYRLYKTTVLKTILKRCSSRSFAFQMEIIARAEAMGFKINEVPIIFYDRNAGTSKLNFVEIVLFMIVILRLYLTL